MQSFPKKRYTFAIVCLAEVICDYKNKEDLSKEHEQILYIAFIPIGKFTADTEYAEISTALFTAAVKEVKPEMNSYTKKHYLHLLIESYDMDFGVIADADLVRGVEIRDVIVTPESEWEVIKVHN